MEIGAAADEKMVLAGKSAEKTLFSCMIGTVDSLYSHKALFFQERNQFHHSGIAHMIQGRVGQHRDAVRLQYQLHRLFGRYLFPGHKAGTVISYIAIKGFFNALYIAPTKQIFCIVGPSDYGVRKFLQKFIIGDLNAGLLQKSAHFMITQGSGFCKAFEPVQKFRVFVINIKSYNMNILSLVLGG